MLISLPALCRAIFKVEEVILSIFTFLNEVGVQIGDGYVFGCIFLHSFQHFSSTPYREAVFLDWFLEFLEGV